MCTLFLGQMVTKIMTYKRAFQFRKSVYEYHWSESGYRSVRHESDKKFLEGLVGKIKIYQQSVIRVRNLVSG